MPLKLDNLYFFLIINSKDIKVKQLTINFNILNSTILQSNIIINIWIIYYNPIDLRWFRLHSKNKNIL